MRALLTGGGTAGHINPALAIAQTIRENDPDAVVEFVGNRMGKENELVLREGYRLHHVESRGIARSLHPRALLGNCKAVYLAITSPGSEQTRSILRDFAPDVVIGTGGYACWPLMRAAAAMGIPTVLHESNAKPGLAVRVLKPHVDRILVNFESTRRALADSKKVIRVGNPLRNGFGELSREEARRRLGIAPECFFILSFGGSMGAEEVNFAAIETMRRFSSRQKDVLHLHAAGKRDWEKSKARFDALGLNESAQCRLVDYIYDMPLQMMAADLIVSRAGAMTLSELSLLGKASILIPSPYVASKHQLSNARALADRGAARLIIEEKNQSERQKERMSKALLKNVSELYADREASAQLQKNIRAFADPEANRLIWEEIRSLCAASHDPQKALRK